MKKQDEKPPEEVAKDLENIDFDEIDADDLKEVFGGESIPISNCNCCC